MSEQTGVPCYVAYYRRYLPYFQKVKELVNSGELGKIVNVQVRLSNPPRKFDAERAQNSPGVYSRRFQEVAISMTWPLISLTFCRSYSE